MDAHATTDAIRISVVIPTYNRAHIIERALGSVFAQTVPPAEVIVVDDGSTDATPELLSSYGPRVKVLLQNHGGPSRARNLGVAAAVSPWIAFLDSDDTWSTTHLERLAGAVAATGGEAALYFANAEWETAGGVRTFWDLHGYRPAGAIDFVRDAAGLVYREVQPMLLPFSLFRKDAYESSGGLWEKLWSAEDTHLFMRLGALFPLCAVDSLGGRVTSDELNNNQRLTTSFSSDTRQRSKSLIAMYHDLFARFPDLPPQYVDRLRDWLAGSHWRLSRIAWREGRYGEFLQELFRVVRIRPKSLWGIVLDRQRRTRSVWL